MKQCFFILSVLFAIVCVPHTAYGQEKPKGSLEVVPAFVEVTLEDPGQVIEIPITYTNHSDQYVSLEVYPVDFKQKDGTGAISFLGQEAGSYSYSLSSFLSLESQSMELAPREKKTFSVTAQNRTDLSPGGHYAAVIARMIPGAGEDVTAVAPSVSSLILLRKTGGERFHLSLKDVNWPSTIFSFSYPKYLTLLFQNEGNIHLVPFGRIEIRDMLGRLTYDGNINPSSLRVFPSSRRYIDAQMTRLNASMPITFNTVSIKGTDSLKKTNFVHRESFIYINPLFLVGLVTGVIVFIFLRRRRRRTSSVVIAVNEEKSKKPARQFKKAAGRKDLKKKVFRRKGK